MYSRIRRRKGIFNNPEEEGCFQESERGRAFSRIQKEGCFQESGAGRVFSRIWRRKGCNTILSLPRNNIIAI